MTRRLAGKRAVMSGSAIRNCAAAARRFEATRVCGCVPRHQRDGRGVAGGRVGRERWAGAVRPVRRDRRGGGAGDGARRARHIVAPTPGSARSRSVARSRRSANRSGPACPGSTCGTWTTCCGRRGRRRWPACRAARGRSTCTSTRWRRGLGGRGFDGGDGAALAWQRAAGSVQPSVPRANTNIPAFVVALAVADRLGGDDQ